jgi:hypothetical protein
LFQGGIRHLRPLLEGDQRASKQILGTQEMFVNGRAS